MTTTAPQPIVESNGVVKKETKKRTPPYEKIPETDFVVRFQGFEGTDLLASALKKAMKAAQVKKQGEYKAMFIENERVKLAPSTFDVKEKKREYRRGYRLRRASILKQHKNAQDPSKKKKQQEYAKNPDVAQKKKLQSQQRRGIPTLLKNMNPKYYDELMNLSRERNDKKRQEREIREQILKEALKEKDPDESTETSETSESEEEVAEKRKAQGELEHPAKKLRAK